MSRREIFLRALIAVSAALAATLDAPTALSAPLALLALLNGGQLLARLAPRDDLIESWLIAAAGGTVLLILLGVALNYLPGGITRASYGIGFALVSFALLAAARARRGPAGGVHLMRPTAVLASFMVLAGGTAIAFQIGSAGVARQDRQAVLALSAPAYGSEHARVLVSSVNAGGSYELSVLPDGRPGGSPVQLKLAARGAHSAELTVQLPSARCYWSIVLSGSGARQGAERVLKLWAATSSAGLARRQTRPSAPLAATRAGAVTGCASANAIS